MARLDLELRREANTGAMNHGRIETAQAATHRAKERLEGKQAHSTIGAGTTR